MSPVAPKAKRLRDDGWSLVETRSYWASWETMYMYINMIVIPHVKSEREGLNLDYVVFVLILDNYYNVHTS